MVVPVTWVWVSLCLVSVPLIPGSQPGPWAKTAAKQQAPSIVSSDDFPSLGSGPRPGRLSWLYWLILTPEHHFYGGS